jgi:phage terminase large subunit-like protein
VTSLRDLLAALPPAERAALFAGMSAEELLALQYDWPTWARDSQLPPPGDAWDVWLIMSGRGAGKTRSGSEAVRAWARDNPGARIGIICRTSADARDVAVEGPSGVLACCPPGERPLYESSKRRLTWRNGSQATCFSADEPDLLRGPQHDLVWCDELASRLDETWSNILLGLRSGRHPRAIITTTPRPVKVLRDLVGNPRCVVVRESTYANASNLAPSALAAFRSRYEGTRTGAQELHGHLLLDTPGSLWSRELLDRTRVASAPVDLERVVIGVDPATTSGADADLTGVVTVARGRDGHLYVLRDDSLRASPAGWASKVVTVFDAVQADRVVVERNAGGEMLEATLRQIRADLPITTVVASRGKVTRGEPVAARFEQNRAHIVGSLSELEEELASFAPGLMEHSPDRADACVWACSSLMESAPGEGILTYMREEAAAARARAGGAS